MGISGKHAVKQGFDSASGVYIAPQLGTKKGHDAGVQNGIEEYARLLRMGEFRGAEEHRAYEGLPRDICADALAAQLWPGIISREARITRFVYHVNAVIYPHGDEYDELMHKGELTLEGKEVNLGAFEEAAELAQREGLGKSLVLKAVIGACKQAESQSPLSEMLKLIELGTRYALPWNTIYEFIKGRKRMVALIPLLADTNKGNYKKEIDAIQALMRSA